MTILPGRPRHPSAAPALLLAALVAACSGDNGAAPAARPIDAAAAQAAPVPAPTPEQARALSNRTHRAHLDASPRPTVCADCHRIVGRSRDLPTTHRCLGCHPRNSSAIHARVGDAQARECLTCHDFLGKDADPWSCAACHIAGEDVRQGDIAALAPKIELHGREWCGNCHVPHGERSIEAKNCVECHRDLELRHRDVELVGAASCQECHRGHDPASRAGGLCTSCHVQISTSATFKGHDACTSCHTPHDRRARVKSCTSCHERTAVLGAPRAPEHQKCLSCHDPHRAKSSPVDSCQRCHTDVAAKHPRDARLGACASCHEIHPARGQSTPPARAQACATCHHDARSDTAFHAGGLACTGCHQPHGFSLRGAGAALCATCHGGRPPAGARSAVQPKAIAVSKGHADCTRCHREAAHAPARRVPACATCHAPEQRELTRGHDNCTGCHRPHDGQVTAACTSCHEKKRTGRHATPAVAQRATCQTCHRPHGPRGPAAPLPCTRCHDKELPGMHAVPQHRDCKSCHRFHDQAPRQGRTACLTPCHTAMVNHEPAAQSCTACHPFEGAVRP